MHTNRPVTRIFAAAPSNLSGLRVFFMFLLGASMICATALCAAQAPAATASAAPAVAPAHAEFVGADTCASCHEEVVKKFASNPHTKMALMPGNHAGITCENCHGAGSEHVAGGGDVTKIFNPLKHSAKEVDEKCQSCHANTHPDFARSPHAKANVSCISCHSIHGTDVQPSLRVAALLGSTASSTTLSKEREYLLKAPEPVLCYSCHAEKNAQFNMPFHHKVNEGLVKCTDCHDVHGTFERNNIRSRNDSNQICTKCHTDKRGPFVYEHTPIKGEGCIGCHTPHGSQNARLLNMPNINVLCNQCHSPVASATIHGQGAGSSELAPCTSCHTYIHGSNMNVAFLR
jgi:predicted CXXCH cytochrome family protein